MKLATTPTPSLTERTRAAGQDVLSGRRRGVLAFLPFAGPAIVASVAYTDPGNFATNIQAGASYGYGLLWVVVAANLIAMLFQAQAAKLGIVTGRSLAELCRLHFPGWLVALMWVGSEIAAMATDLAEFLGAAIGLSLLTGLGLFPCLIATGIATSAMLLLHGRGFRPMELLITAFVGAIGLCYAIELFVAPPDWGQAAYHAVVPHLADANAVTLAVSIIGATVMPHAIYLHSALMRDRMPAASDADRRHILRFSNREVVLALSFAGIVNMAMLMMAARAFYPDHADVAEIETAYRTLVPLLGAGAAYVFMGALLASGFSSSVVGTMAGQGIMQDFVRFQIPIWVRRLVTMAPAFVVVGLGLNPTTSLVLSQVVLSLALPLPMVALVVLSRRRAVMGDFATARWVHWLTVLACAIVLGMNVLLLWQLAQ